MFTAIEFTQGPGQHFFCLFRLKSYPSFAHGYFFNACLTFGQIFVQFFGQVFVLVFGQGFGEGQ